MGYSYEVLGHSTTHFLTSLSQPIGYASLVCCAGLDPAMFYGLIQRFSMYLSRWLVSWSKPIRGEYKGHNPITSNLIGILPPFFSCAPRTQLKSPTMDHTILASITHTKGMEVLEAINGK